VLQAFKYRVQAAAKLAGNHDAVTRFALRAVGTTGRHYSAPLADPHAKPNMSFYDAVTVALACTAVALLRGTEAGQELFRDCTWLGESAEARKKTGAAVVSSLAYLRDRVGVPRDLQLPAARQLRAHLNWTIDSVHDAVGLEV
jgi:glutathione S-transferase